MAARLDLFHLRRHALPVHDDLLDLRRPATPGGGPDRPASRPRLIAAWHADADGRLACTWSAAPDDPA